MTIIMDALVSLGHSALLNIKLPPSSEYMKNPWDKL